MSGTAKGLGSFYFSVGRTAVSVVRATHIKSLVLKFSKYSALETEFIHWILNVHGLYLVFLSYVFTIENIEFR